MSAFATQIDELIDNSLDKFFANHVYNNKIFGRLTNEISFVKYQIGIQSSLEEFIGSTIDRKATKAIIRQAENEKRIVEVMKRYAAYYSFLWIAYHYKGKRLEYVNNVVEMGAAQQRSTFRISNFYNSDNNSILFKLYDLIRDIQFVLSIDKPRGSILSTPQGVAQYRLALDFISEMGEEFVQKYLKVKGPSAIHNLIKTLIIVRLYKSDEKTDIIRILEEAELEQGEYTYIDIIVPRIQHFDYSTIEALLTQRQVRSGLADDIYDTLNRSESAGMSIDDKVRALLESGILVPVVEDFLLVHKDTEKYEREQQVDKRTRIEDTRLRYIVSKLEAVSELFSAATKNNPQRREQIEKLMYMPMKERRAVLFNELEDIKIINKIENQGKQTENTEYYHDLLTYKSYAYVPFKAMQHQGFTYAPERTVLAVRSTNFEFAKELKSTPVEVRSASKSTAPVNICGFVIRPPGSPVQCYKVGEVVDIRKFTMKSRTSGKVYQTDNGFLGAIRFLRRSIAKGAADGPVLVWMLDTEKDKFDLKGYESVSSSNTQEYLKLMLAHVYDSLQELVTGRIIDDLRKLHSRGEIFSITEIELYVREMQRRTLRLTDEMIQQITEVSVTELYPAGPTTYDIREDRYPGLDDELEPIKRLGAPVDDEVPNLIIDIYGGFSDDTGDAVALPEIPAKQQILAGDAALEETSTLPVDEKLLEYISQNNDYQQAVCQHNLTWQETMQYKRDRNNTDYEEALFNFIETFVQKDDDDEYVCKSCDETLPIKHYVADGVYDDEQQKFITFAIPMDIPLEDMREYEKYGRIIRDLDMRIASVCEMINLKFFVGRTSSIKWRRKGVVKNVIDLLLTHNRIGKNSNHKSRKERAAELYGIDSKVTNLFFFELDDSIIDYSSRDRDFFRLIKLNNIMAYIIVAILMELNDEQIVNLGKDRKARVDKLCTIELFDRVAPTIFGKLSILRTTDGQREPLTNLPNLAYTLFIISCIITRNRRWYMEVSDKAEKGKDALKTIDPLMQRSVIHTVVDLLNNILEVYSMPDSNRPWLYTSLGGRFMNHLKTVYDSPNLYARLDILRNPTVISKERKVAMRKVREDALIIPTGKYKIIQPVPPTHEQILKIQRGHLLASRGIPKQKPLSGIPTLTYEHIDRDTNCSDGQFHKWEGKGTDFVCKKCKQSLGEIIAAGELSEDEELKMIGNIYNLMIKNISTTACINGQKHSYVSKDGMIVCTVCSRSIGEQADNTDIRKLSKIVDTPTVLENPAAVFKGVSKEVKHRVAKLKTDSPSTELITAIQNVLGRDAKLPGDRELLNDMYIIERDYIGNKLSKPIVLNAKDNKLKHRAEHPFFKCSVIYYTDEHREVDVYYDAISHAFLGFRERNREYVVADEVHYLKVNLSLKSQIELIGFSGVHMRIVREAADLGILQEDLKKPGVFQKLTNLLYRERYQRIIQSIGELQRIIYTIRNGAVLPEGERTEPNSDEPDPSLEIIYKYIKVLSKINLGAGEDRLFADWQDVLNEIPIVEPPAGELPDEWISAQELARDDISGKTALHYMIIELSHLIQLNNDKFTASNIVGLISQLINYVFNMWNTDAIEHELEIKRFIMLLDTRRAIDARHKITDEDTEVMNSDGTGAIIDVGTEEAIPPEEIEELTTLSDLIEGGAEMERDETFINDFSSDREAYQ